MTKRVLIVEDDASFADFLSTTIRLAGCKPEVVADGPDAVERFPFHHDQVLQRGTHGRPIRECVDRIAAVGNDGGGRHHQSSRKCSVGFMKNRQAKST